MLKGEIQLPGDKSISHRCAMFSALRVGESEFTNFPDSADCAATVSCMRQLGVKIIRERDRMIVSGSGKILKVPAADLNAANSGTTIRLLSGILAGQPFASTIFGDQHLNRRPMGRIMGPLRQMGGKIGGEEDKYPPLKFSPVKQLNGIEFSLPIASAQVKSCVLLAGLFADGVTQVIEPVPTRDHTERMLGLNVTENENKVKTIFSQSDHVVPELSMAIPGDISSAAFFMAGALGSRGSELLIRNITLNPTRSGVLMALKKMNADLSIDELASPMEPRGNVTVRYSALKNIKLSGKMIANVIDEIPVLAVLATRADGVFEVRDAGELRVKESDRIKAVCSNLKKCGVAVEELPDGLRLTGPQKIRGSKITTFGDHRIAMAFAIAGLWSEGEMTFDDPHVVSVSFPGFWDTLRRIGK